MDAWNGVPPETARRLLETQYLQSLVEVTERMFAAAGIGHGQRVLDIGTGGGDIALAAADRVGPTGWVLATDASMDALRGLAAQLRARPQPLPIALEVVAAESLSVNHYRRHVPPSRYSADFGYRSGYELAWRDWERHGRHNRHWHRSSWYGVSFGYRSGYDAGWRDAMYYYGYGYRPRYWSRDPYGSWYFGFHFEG